MAVLQLDDKQFPLSGATIRIGAGADADVVLPTDAALGVQAVIERSGDLALAIRRAAPQSQVRVNGVELGPEPTPLVHGDKVEVAGVELRFADESKRGVTQYTSLEAVSAAGGARRTGAARPTLASGGRLISLVDGKEYPVPEGGLVIGRDAGCDVVVPRNDVSRRHAELAPTDSGYVVRDTSSNGVFVNGERVQGSQRLSRADVIRIGTEEFRFYADVPSPTTAAAGALTPAEPVRAEAPVPSLADTLFTPRAIPAAPPPLAELEVLNEGPSKGIRHAIRTPLAQVGRGPTNDVRLADESVSEAHAKLQRRDDGWYVVDMNSTNGTWVGGSRVTGERRLEGAPDVRFGGVKLRFIPAGTTPEMLRAAEQSAATTERNRAAATTRAPETASSPSAGTSRLLWLLLALVAVAAVYLLVRGRA